MPSQLGLLTGITIPGMNLISVPITKQAVTPNESGTVAPGGTSCLEGHI